MNKRKNKQQSNSRHKRVKLSFSDEFIDTPSQTYDLRLRYSKPKSLFTLPQSFSGKASDFLKLMITKSFIEVLFGLTFAKQLTISKPFDLFWTFVAVWISMGLVRLPNVRKHFEKTAFWTNKVAITFISRNKFDHVLQSMKGDVDDLCRIFIHNVDVMYKPNVKGSIDETILAFTGKSSIKVYLPAKPHPNGIKLFTYVDEHGILCSLIVYKKRTIPVDIIFKRLLKKYKNREIKIYADRWFGSKKAMEYLNKNKQKFVLAMPKNRGKKMWEEMRQIADSKGYVERKWDENPSVRAVTVKVRGIICNFLINHHDFLSSNDLDEKTSSTTTQQQQYYNSLVDDYNYNMKRVDQFNQAFYLHLPVIRQSNVPIGMRRAILRFAVINAYHMYELYHGKKLRQDEFLEKLMYELLGFSADGWQSFKSGHQFLSTNKIIKCAVCTKGKKPSSCSHWCPQCRRPMCKNCFLKQHIK